MSNKNTNYITGLQQLLENVKTQSAWINYLNLQDGSDLFQKIKSAFLTQSILNRQLLTEHTGSILISSYDKLKEILTELQAVCVYSCNKYSTFEMEQLFMIDTHSVVYCSKQSHEDIVVQLLTFNPKVLEKLIEEIYKEQHV